MLPGRRSSGSPPGHPAVSALVKDDASRCVPEHWRDATIDPLRPDATESWWVFVVNVNSTDDLVWELQDQVQGVQQMVSWLVANAGGDPAVIGHVPVSDAREAA